jgi:hypothetical protein
MRIHPSVSPACFLTVLLVGCAASCSSGSASSDRMATIIVPGSNKIEPPSPGRIPECADGSAHPNVCCSSAPGQPTSCVTKPNDPFRPCDSGWFAFPQRERCCPLSGAQSCVDAPEGQPSSTGDAAAGAQCHFFCGPNGYAPATATAAGIQGISASDVCCEGSGPNVVCQSRACNRPGNSCAVDAGTCVPQPQICGPQCPMCPAGWSPPAEGQVDLCCRRDGTSEQCFSVAGSIVE